MYVVVVCIGQDIINVQSQEEKMPGIELSFKLKAQTEPAVLKIKGNGVCNDFFLGVTGEPATYQCHCHRSSRMSFTTYFCQ